MTRMKRLFLIVLFIFAVLVMCSLYLRASVGEIGCSIDTKWVDQEEFKKGIRKSQFNESNVITINFLTPISYGGVSKVNVYGRKTTKVHINNLSIKYIFGNNELQPTTIQLTRINNKTAKIVSDIHLQNKEISNIPLNSGERIRITYFFKFGEDDVVFNKGEVSLSYEYTENEQSNVISHTSSIVKVISKYNCLW